MTKRRSDGIIKFILRCAPRFSLLPTSSQKDSGSVCRCQAPHNWPGEGSKQPQVSALPERRVKKRLPDGTLGTFTQDNRGRSQWERPFSVYTAEERGDSVSLKARRAGCGSGGAVGRADGHLLPRILSSGYALFKSLPQPRRQRRQKFSGSARKTGEFGKSNLCFPNS